MPLVRYEIQNEYKLGSLELYRTASKDDSQGVLEGVTMVGFVGILRQLGDLAEFAAELFHNLHEDVMATAARSHGLIARVLQLEAEFPYIEKVFFSDADPLYYFSSPGVDWHATIRSDQNHFTKGDLPRFIRGSYEECRGPPRLFLLDKFDVGGAEACLKRYTDPSYFKRQWASTELAKAGKAQQERKARRVKKKAVRRIYNGDVNGAAIAPRMKPRRVRYSLLSSENVEYYLDNPTLQPRENQLNSLSKPRDTALVANDKYRMISFNPVNGLSSKECYLSPGLRQTSDLQHSEAQAPSGDIQLEYERAPQGQKDIQEEISSLLRISAATPQTIEEQSLFNKEEQEDSLKVSSLKEMASESDRFEDAMAHSEADSEASKQQLEDNIADMHVRLDENGSLSVPTKQFDSSNRAGYIQEIDQDSDSHEQLLKNFMVDGENPDETGTFRGHTEKLRKTVGELPAKTEIYGDAMGTQSETFLEVSRKQLPDNTFGITDSQPNTKSVTTANPCFRGDREVEISQQFNDGLDPPHTVSPAKTYLGDAGAEAVIDSYDAYKSELTPENTGNNHFTQESLRDTHLSKATSTADWSDEPKLSSASKISGEPSGNVKSKLSGNPDSHSNEFLEAKYEEISTLGAAGKEEVSPWETLRTISDSPPAESFGVPLEHLPVLKELIRNGSSELDGFEDAIGSELDISSEPSSKQEVYDISSSQGVTEQINSMAKSSHDSCQNDEIKVTQKLLEDGLHGDLDTENWRRDDTLSINLENSDRNRLGPSDLIISDRESGDLKSLLKTHLPGDSVMLNDMVKLVNEDVEATYGETDLTNVFEENFSHQHSRPAQMTVFEDAQLPPHSVNSDHELVISTVTDNVRAIDARVGDGFKTKHPEGALAYELNANTESDLQEGVLEQCEQVVQKIGCSEADMLEDADGETQIDKMLLDDQPHLVISGKKSELSPLLEPFQAKNIPGNDDMVSNVSSNAEAAETIAPSLELSGPSSVPLKLDFYNASHSRTYFESYQEDLSGGHGLPGCSLSVLKNLEVDNAVGNKPSNRLGREDLSTTRTVEHADVFLVADLKNESLIIQTQSNPNHQFLPLSPKSPLVNPMPALESPTGLNEFSGKFQDAREETSGQLQMKETGKPIYNLTLDDNHDDSPAISPIVSPMWSSESPTPRDEPGGIFVEEFDIRDSSILLSPPSPSPPSSPIPTALHQRGESLSESESKGSPIRSFSDGSSPSDAAHGSLPLNEICISGIVGTNPSTCPSTLSCSLSSRCSSPTSQSLHVSHNEDVLHSDDKLKVYEDLSDDQSSDKLEPSIPVHKTSPHEISPVNPTVSVLAPFDLPESLGMEELPSTELEMSNVPSKSCPDSAEPIESFKSTSEVGTLNKAVELCPSQIVSNNPGTEPTLPSVVTLETKTESPEHSSSESRTSPTHEYISSSSLQSPVIQPKYIISASSVEGKTSPTYENVSSLIGEPAAMLSKFSTAASPAHSSPEAKSSPTYEDAPMPTEKSPTPLLPTPSRKPPTGFQGLSRALTTKGPGDHRHHSVDAVSMSSLGKSRKVSIQTPPSKPRSLNDREVLLDQIRTRSFNLRHTSMEKREVPARPIPNINVAAILEKANSMRQAVVGSDEDSDSWSDG